MAGPTVATTPDNPHVVAQNDTVRLEVNQRGFHRLVSQTNPKRHTAWAVYQTYTYLDGYVGATPYYTGGDCAQILTPHDFLVNSAITELSNG